MKGFKTHIQKLFNIFGLTLEEFYQKFAYWSISKAKKQQALSDLVNILRRIVPNIAKQETGKDNGFHSGWELKMRAQQAFQCLIMMRAIEDISKKEIMVVDIGDAYGTQMLYLKEIAKRKHEIETLSVNLDPVAINTIQGQGLTAILKRAEDIEPEDVNGNADLITLFETMEHLNNPVFFLQRMAEKSLCNRMLVTVPYLSKSRMGLHHIRSQSHDPCYARNTHVFELNPEDWSLLFFHSGWKVIYSWIYYQYPRKWPLISGLLRWYWRRGDYEGFWAAILQKDSTYTELYKDS
ncbi:methyltransferase domain-containing protein [candidate division KSB1 bacterium]|nr:methyltransferase domain-containing protein [candidate division KSB1 bacterium]